MLELKNVIKGYPDKSGKLRTVLSDISLEVTGEEFITVVGPTGCGKSTLLRMVLGSERPDAGQVLLDGIEITGPGRDRGIVFQNYSLFPDKTVRENVTFGLELEEFSLFGRYIFPDRKRLAAFRERADEYLDRVGLLAHGDKYPQQLSGGMRQRAAIAQAMIMKPRILLMDEPLGALDVGTREEMQVFILENWEIEKQTVFFVTHDLEEAIFLGTRIIVLSQYYENSSGAKIVRDFSIEWPTPRPTAIKNSQAFGNLARDIRHAGLDPERLQKIEAFDKRQREVIDWKSLLS